MYIRKIPIYLSFHDHLSPGFALSERNVRVQTRLGVIAPFALKMNREK